MKQSSHMASNMADIEDSAIAALIELYQNQENLYNSQLRSYHDRDAARESYNWISLQIGKGWTVEQTKAKLKWLRDSYTRNRGKVEGSKTSGCSADSIYQVKWKWYHQLDAFLRPYCKVMTKGTSNLVSETQTQIISSQAEPVEPEESQPLLEDLPQSPLTAGPNFAQLERERNDSERKRRRTPNKNVNLTESAVSVLQEVAGHFNEKKTRLEKKTDNEMYCLYLASQLEKLSKRNQVQARKQIGDIVFQLTMQEMDES